MFIKEPNFMIINLSSTEVGVLKTIGKRDIVVNVKLLPKADEGDNMWLVEQIKLLYEQYHARVSEYGEDN